MVAMTRPKDRLIITATWKTPEKTLDALRDDLTAPIAPQLLEKSASLSRWIALAALLPGSPIKCASFPPPERAHPKPRRPRSNRLSRARARRSPRR